MTAVVLQTFFESLWRICKFVDGCIQHRDLEIERASSSMVKIYTANGTTQTKTALKIVFRAMTLGKEGTYLPIHSSPNLHLHFDALTLNQPNTLSNAPYRPLSARVHDLKDCAAMLDVFQKHGHDEIDSARVYGGGSSEEYLGQLKRQERDIVMDTKLTPRQFGP